ncbi:MAG: adaptor protein MecA, partial [Clostridiales bacterium]|nr:adaptor protein MecA [Clostridiales bacterium]
MKVEKISETQIKFILSQADLSDRNIRLAELA